jgi:nucleotide-binding universal stress UspA family protein
VIESYKPAETLLDLARLNHVDLIVLGAPAPRSERWHGGAPRHRP